MLNQVVGLFEELQREQHTDWGSVTRQGLTKSSTGGRVNHRWLQHKHNCVHILISLSKFEFVWISPDVYETEQTGQFSTQGRNYVLKKKEKKNKTLKREGKGMFIMSSRSGRAESSLTPNQALFLSFFFPFILGRMSVWRVGMSSSITRLLRICREEDSHYICVSISACQGGSEGWDELGDWDWHVYTTT